MSDWLSPRIYPRSLRFARPGLPVSDPLRIRRIRAQALQPHGSTRPRFGRHDVFARADASVDAGWSTLDAGRPPVGHREARA